MANQSQKKNKQESKSKISFMHNIMYPLFAIFVCLNMFFLLDESISFWHFLFCLIVALVSVLCIKQTIKCWQLGLPAEASEYYIDILALNTLVAVFDPITHKIWYNLTHVGMFIGSSLSLSLPNWESTSGNTSPPSTNRSTRRIQRRRPKEKRKTKRKRLSILKNDFICPYIFLQFNLIFKRLSFIAKIYQLLEQFLKQGGLSTTYFLPNLVASASYLSFSGTTNNKVNNKINIKEIKHNL